MSLTPAVRGLGGCHGMMRKSSIRTENTSARSSTGASRDCIAFCPIHTAATPATPATQAIQATQATQGSRHSTFHLSGQKMSTSWQRIPRDFFFEPRPQSPISRELLSAYTILVGAYDAASSFLVHLENSRRNRKAKGSLTNQEQDLLRAMFIFACAGLDSTLKQLVRDALPLVVDRHEGARSNFRLFVEKRLARQGGPDPRLLSKLFTEENPRSVLLAELVLELTSQSLQSKEQVLRTASYFDIPSDNLTSDIAKLSKVFQSRNEISHELDVDQNQPTGHRRPRHKTDMIEQTAIILQLATAILQEVDQKLQCPKTD